MKTEQEQIEEMIKIFTDNREVCHHMRCVECKYHGDEDCVYSSCAYSLYQAGYGDVSEYKAEIEQLKAKNKVLGDSVAKAFTNGFNTGRKQVEKDIRRAKINAMIELKEKIVEHMGEREYMGVKYKQGVFSESEIDELIKEIENGKDKG